MMAVASDGEAEMSALNIRRPRTIIPAYGTLNNRKSSWIQIVYRLNAVTAFLKIIYTSWFSQPNKHFRFPENSKFSFTCTNFTG